MSDNKEPEFLKPQQPIEDPLGQIDMLPLMVVQRNYFLKENEKPITQSLFDSVEKLFEAAGPDCKAFSQDALPSEADYNGYKWKQNIENNQITITYDSPTDITADDIKITESSITSPFLNGNFYDTVQNPQIDVTDKTVMITLTVSKRFLVLIKSGENMDKYSQFFLGAFCNKFGEIDSFDKLLIKAANSGLVFAMTSLAISYLQRSEREHAIYWFYQFARNSNELFPYVTIVDQLLAIDSPRYANLSENILITIAPKFPPALIFLSRLYLDDISGFTPNDSLGARYLESAVINSPTPESFRMLAQLYITGRGITQNVELGVELLRESGLSDIQIRQAVQLFIEIEEKRTGKPFQINNLGNKESLTDKIADYSLAAVILVGVAAAGVYLYSRFFNRRK